MIDGSLVMFLDLAIIALRILAGVGGIALLLIAGIALAHYPGEGESGWPLVISVSILILAGVSLIKL